MKPLLYGFALGVVLVGGFWWALPYIQPIHLAMMGVWLLFVVWMVREHRKAEREMDALMVRLDAALTQIEQNLRAAS